MRFFARNTARPPQALKTTRLGVEQLEDRVVPSGTPLDLTTAGAIATLNSQSDVTDGPVAIFQQVSTQPTGTGVIQSFLRVENHGANQTVEQGYNTNARPTQFDEKTDHNFTRAIKLSEIPVVTIDGVAYRQFLLDANQPGSSPLLSLDQLRIYEADTPNLTGYDSSNLLAGRSALFDLDSGDTGGDTWVKIDTSLNHGSGSGDIVINIADRLFTPSGTSSNPYVYLYSRFGDNIAARAGFEEFAVSKGLPAPAVDTLSGFVLDSSTGVGLSGVSIVLSGTTSTGQVLNLTLVTDINGAFDFVGLPAGVYTLTELPATLPPDYTPDGSAVGTVSGKTDGVMSSFTLLSQIMLGTGQNGINYDFFADSSNSVPTT